MEKRELATNLELIVQDNGIAEIVFGPEGGMPATDKQGHAALGSIWRELSADSRVHITALLAVATAEAAAEGAAM